MKNRCWSNRKNSQQVFIAAAFLFFICLPGAAKAQTADGFDSHTDSTVKVVVVQPDSSIRPGGLLNTLLSDVAGTWSLHFLGIATQDALVDGTAAPLDVTLPTDFFRSTNAGAAHWNDPASWESSHDGSTGWIPATLTPTSTANTITILATHVCNVTASVHADQVVGDGGIEVFAPAILTIDDGPGTDLTENQGVGIRGGTIVNNGSLNINNTLGLDPGSSLTGNAPVYGSGSTLVYGCCNGNFTPGVEWSVSPGSGTPGPGQPFIVAISSGTLTMPATVRSVAGTFTMAQNTVILGADLHLYDWLNGFGTTPYFVSNGHALVFKGSNVQNIQHSFIDYMTVDKTGGYVNLQTNNLQINQQLTLINGNINAPFTTVLSIANPAPGAITGGSANSHIVGALRRNLPAGLAAGSTYLFPIGALGTSNYDPFELVSPTTNAAVTIEAQVRDFSSGGTPGMGIGTLKTNRFWQASVTSGSFINTSVRLTDPTVGSTDLIGRSSTQTGVYDSIGGIVSNGTIQSNTITSLGFFNIGTAPAATPTSTPTNTPTATPTPPCGTPGTLDTSFNGTGIVTTSIATHDIGNAVAIQSNGRIVVAGVSYNGSNDDFAVVRYNIDGTLDTSFNGTGKVTTPIGSGDDVAYSVAIQSDGKIVAAGYSSGGFADFAIVRYNTNGTLDTSFNGTGKVTTPIGFADDGAYSVAIQSDGKIVAAGFTEGSLDDFAIVRYNIDGTLDTSFNGTGKVTTAIGAATFEQAHSVAIQSDGRIVAVGYSSTNGSDNDFAAVRYNTNGTLDTSFNGTGIVTTPIGSGSDAAYSVLAQSDGKIVAVGFSSDSGSGLGVAVVRYNTDGTLDTSFNGTGKVTTPGTGVALSAALQSDGRIVAAGYAFLTTDFVLVRYNANGTLDTSFNGTGKVIDARSAASMTRLRRSRSNPTAG